MIEIGPDTINSLAEKLSDLELTDAERWVLDRLIERAGQFEMDVAGFSDNYSGLDSGADLSSLARQLGAGAGIIRYDA